MSCECSGSVIYKNNDHLIELTDLTVNGVALSGASPTFQIYDSDDTEVSGASGTLTEVGTSGDYSAELDTTITQLLTKGEEYRICVSGSHNGADFEFNLTVTIERRGAS